MDPLGNITERISEEEILETPDHKYDFDPRMLPDNNENAKNVPLIKKLFRDDRSNNLRRTSSFMLRSRTEGGGKFFCLRHTFIMLQTNLGNPLLVSFIFYNDIVVL